MREREIETTSFKKEEKCPLLKCATDLTRQVTVPSYDSKLLKLRSCHCPLVMVIVGIEEWRIRKMHPFLQLLHWLVVESSSGSKYFAGNFFLSSLNTLKICVQNFGLDSSLCIVLYNSAVELWNFHMLLWYFQLAGCVCIYKAT